MHLFVVAAAARHTKHRIDLLLVAMDHTVRASLAGAMYALCFLVDVMIPHAFFARVSVVTVYHSLLSVHSCLLRRCLSPDASLVVLARVSANRLKSRGGETNLPSHCYGE